jgi:DNA-binding response OmpR family regulator/tetratricopeptide (TPR) repeat protein
MLLALATCRVDLLRGLVYRADGEIALTTRESELLSYLSERPFSAVSRDELLSQVWGYSDAVVTRACDNTIRRLREKIEDDPQHPKHVLTVHGTGYRFVPSDGMAPQVTPQLAPQEPAEPEHMVFEAGDRRVDLSRGQITSENREKVALTAREIALLRVLHGARGAVLERRALQRAIGGEGGGRAIDNLVSRLRKKLELDPAEPRHLLTAPGGYRLELPQGSQHPRREEAPALELGAPLLGRATLLAELQRRLQVRPLVVLVGPVGVGKSRLAQSWAQAQGATWVDLREAADAAGVAERVARALDLGLGDLGPAERVAAAVASQAVSVVLDHLDTAAPAVSSLLERWTRAGPRSRWLATSQIWTGPQDSPLAFVLEVPPLSEDDAVELFLERVRRPRRDKSTFDPAVLRQIVSRLDCLPLPIELAASRCAVLSPQAVLERLSLDLLAEPRGKAEQVSLRSTLQAAVDLLDPEELEALRVLSLASTFDIDDAEAMLGPYAVDLVQALRDRSLLHEDPASLDADTLRLTCWQPVRLFFEDERGRLADGGRACATRYIDALTVLADEGEQGPPSPARRERMRVRLDDMTRAVELGVRHGLPRAARCAIAAGWWYAWYGPANVGVSLLQRALELPGLEAPERGLLDHIQGKLLFDLGQHEPSRAAQQRAVAAADGCGDSWLGSRARNALAMALRVLGEEELARESWERACELAQASGDRAYASMLRGQAAMSAGDFEAASACFEQCRTTAACARDLVTFGHYGLGMAALRMGKISVAAEQLAVALDQWEGADRTGWLTLAPHAAYALAMLGARDELEELAPAALEGARRDGWLYEQGMVWAYLGAVRLFAGEAGLAREALERARPLLEQVPSCPPPALAFLEGRTADLALGRGEAAVASEHALRAERLGRQSGSLTATLYGSHSAAMAALGLGEPRAALERMLEAEPLAEQLKSRFDRAVQRARWAVVASALGRDDLAHTWRAEARALLPYTGARPSSELCWWLERVPQNEASA